MVSFSSLFRSNAQRSGRNLLITVLLATASLGLLAGCSDGSDPALPLGSWESSFGEVYTISRSSVTYSSDGTSSTYEASIVYIDDGSLNGGDTAMTTDGDTAVNPGFAVIRYTSTADASWGEVGKYNVFRWADGESDSQKVMTQGGKYSGTFGDEDYRMVVFDSSSAARLGATNDAGYFSFASTVTEQE